jgi:protein-S-isoprenylcysteine O-methyltransferase Ste14
MTTMGRSIIVSALFTVFGGPCLVLVVMPWLITRFRLPAGEPVAQIVAGLVIAGIGLIPLFESIIRFIVVGRGTLMPAVPTDHLVVSGLYRYVRNPMYAGVVTALLGEALLFRSRHMLIYVATVWVIMHGFVCFYEEPTLAATFPEDFPIFKQNVPRWIPRLTPWNKDCLLAPK